MKISNKDIEPIMNIGEEVGSTTSDYSYGQNMPNVLNISDNELPKDFDNSSIGEESNNLDNSKEVLDLSSVFFDLEKEECETLNNLPKNNKPLNLNIAENNEVKKFKGFRRIQKSQEEIKLEDEKFEKIREAEERVKLEEAEKAKKYNRIKESNKLEKNYNVIKKDNYSSDFQKIEGFSKKIINAFSSGQNNQGRIF